MSPQMISLLSALLGAGATFIGVTITIVTLAPALIGIAKTQSSDFFSGEESRTRLDRLLRVLTLNLVLLGVGVFSGSIGLLYESSTFFWISLLCLCLGLILLVSMSYLVAMTILGLLK